MAESFPKKNTRKRAFLGNAGPRGELRKKICFQNSPFIICDCMNLLWWPQGHYPGSFYLGGGHPLRRHPPINFEIFRFSKIHFSYTYFNEEHDKRDISILRYYPHPKKNQNRDFKISIFFKTTGLQLSGIFYRMEKYGVEVVL